ncbi:MAG: Ig-like domain repeat protein [Solirubrobacterales bacterium]
MKKILIFAATLVALAVAPQASHAEPENPIVRGSFNVQVAGKGQVTGTSINCPGDCYAEAAWPDNQLPPENILTAVESWPGWTFQGWDGCVVVPANAKKCEGFYGELGSTVITATFADTQAPWAALGTVKPAAVNTLYFGATGGDNDRVVRMDYLVDGGVVLSNTTGPWPREIDISAFAPGPHTAQVRAFDPAGNSVTTPTQTFEIDRTPVDINLINPVTATNAAAPAFTFSSPSQDFSSATCAIREKGGPVAPTSCSVDEPFSREINTEGEWQFRVVALDRAGNSTEAIHDFVVDRTAPELTITSGPADGDTVEKGDLKYGWTVNDGLAVEQKCAWNDGPAATCDLTASRSVAKGDHTFRLEATDLAGNTSTASRSVKVLGDGTDPDKDPDKDPGPGKDTKAPVIKLTPVKQKLKGLKKGLKLKVTCSEACAGSLKAKAPGNIKFAGKVSLARAGSVRMVLKPAVATRKKLKKARKPLKLVVAAKLADPSGNASTFRLKTKVRK